MGLTVGVTGASGYVGSALSTALQDAGHTIVPMGRNAVPDGRAFMLGEVPNKETLTGLDVLIHCAWDMRASKAALVDEINVHGSINLFTAAANAGVNTLIFVSSMSAFAGCRSLYGRAKLEVEDRVAQLGGIIIRPGLVYGPTPGGMVGALTQLSNHTHVLPMVGTGRFKLHTSHQDDLGRLTVYACENSEAYRGSTISAAAHTGLEFRAIVRRLSRNNLHFIPVPWQLIYAGLRILESLHMRPRIKSDSLLGLVHSNPAPDFKTLDTTGIEFRLLEKHTSN